MLGSTAGVIYIDKSGDTTFTEMERVTGRSSSRSSARMGSISMSSEEMSEPLVPQYKYSYQESWSKEVYNDKLKPNHSYPWAETDYVPNKKDMRSLVLASLFLACVCFAVLIFLFVHRLWRMYKTNRGPDSQGTVRSYLKRFDDDDIRLVKSPPGGWNVTYRRRLANRVQYYWSRELPSPTDASTIIFSEEDDDYPILCDSTARLSERSDPCCYSSDASSSSCSSSSIDSAGLLPQHWPRQQDRTTTVTFHTMHSQSAVITGHNHYHRYRSTGTSSCVGRRVVARPKKSGILSFLRTQFPMEDILLSESLPEGGFSATYCNRLLQDDIYDTIDFSTNIENERMSDYSGSLFQRFLDSDDDVESSFT